MAGAQSPGREKGPQSWLPSHCLILAQARGQGPGQSRPVLPVQHQAWRVVGLRRRPLSEGKLAPNWEFSRIRSETPEGLKQKGKILLALWTQEVLLNRLQAWLGPGSQAFDSPFLSRLERPTPPGGCQDGLQQLQK